MIWWRKFLPNRSCWVVALRFMSANIANPLTCEKHLRFDQQDVHVPSKLKSVAEKLISLPNIASKKWVYEQYDSTVGIVNASTNNPSDAAVIRIQGTDKALVVKVDCNSRYVFSNPKKGTMIAVAEAARNIVCSGGKPLAITNCLNFGNPYNPEVYWQFVNAVEGMSEACTRFDTPVTGGNVSFYNQSGEDPVYPTPVIGMLGMMDHIDNRMTLHFKQKGDLIFLIGESRDDLGGSEYAANICGVEFSPAPYFDLEEEYRVQQAVADAIKNKVVQSAHDVSDGGLFTTLLESSLPNELGFDISSNEEIRIDAFLFGESQSRIVVSVHPEDQDAFIDIMLKHTVEFGMLGEVTEGVVLIDGEDWNHISLWKEKYESALGKIMTEEEPAEALS